VTAVRAESRFVDAAAVAAVLGVERSWVYEHADELGARRLGSGPRARLRFDLEEVDSWLTSCSQGRGSEAVPGRAARAESAAQRNR
jgi:predicted DNA-binding transcriptional regulator AlpA